MPTEKFLHLIHRRRIWPRKFAHQLQLANVLILSITIFSFAWYSVSIQSKVQIKDSHHQLKLLSQNVAVTVANYLLLNNITGLQEHLKKVAVYPELSAIYVQDLVNNSIIAGPYDSNGNIVELEQPPQFLNYKTNHSLVVERDGHIDIWRLIKATGKSEPMAWLRLHYSLNSVHEANILVLKRSLIIALLAIFSSMLILHWLMKKPMTSLRQAAEFSEWLDLAQGRQLNVDNSSEETFLLTRALNKTANKLFQNEESQRSSAILLDSIREVQSQFISLTDAESMFLNVLSKVMQLTKSDMGFVGEILLDGNDKKHMIMRAVSAGSGNKLNNVSSSAANMKFYNLNNLVGCVVQTKKAVIANDPANDPRRGGLPANHPRINTFLGLPIFSGDQIIGLVCVANRVNGYDQGLVAYLQPLLGTIGHIIESFRLDRRKRQFQNELHDQKLRIESILNTVDDAIVIICNNGLIESVNPAAERIFGYASEEIVGVSVNRLLPEFHNEHISFLELGSEIQASYNTPGMCDMDAVHKIGKRFPVEISINKFLTRNETKFTMTVRDITQHKKIEETLRRSENSLKKAQAMVHLGNWELDPITKSMECSQEIYNIFGLDDWPIDVCYYTLLKKMDPVSRQALISAIDMAIINNSPFNLDLAINRFDGTERIVQIQGKLEYVKYNNQCRLLGTIQDVTDRKIVTQQKEEYLSTVSQELRDPLASIQGSLGLINKESTEELPKKAKLLLDSAYRNTHKLLTMVTEVIDIEKIDRGQLNYSMELIDLNEFLKTSVEANQFYTYEYGVKYQLANNLGNVVILADKEHLMHAMSHLLSNAALYSGKNDVVDISTEIIGNVVRVSVIDHGPGIPGSLKPYIFERFPQARTAKKHNNQGPGLGLNITKAIIHRHGGHVGFSSSEGAGSVFYFELPIPQLKSAAV